MVKTFSLKKDGDVYLTSHFQVKEFASKNGKKVYSDTVLIDTHLVQTLERLFVYLNCQKIVVTSGYRTTAHEKAVGNKSGKGYHTTGQAADINCYDKNGKRYHGGVVCCALQELGWRCGIGWIAGHAVHIDSRDYQYWFDEQNSNRSIGTDWYAYMKQKGYIVTGLPKLGDVDGDGKVTTTDARLILQYAVGSISSYDLNISAADLDGDGEVTSTDARLALQKAVEK